MPLIIGIKTSYVVQRGRAGALSSIWLGAAAAIVASIVLGTLLTLSRMQFPQKQQEMFEAAVALIAVVLLLSMVSGCGKPVGACGPRLRAKSTFSCKTRRQAFHWCWPKPSF